MRGRIIAAALAVLASGTAQAETNKGALGARFLADMCIEKPAKGQKYSPGELLCKYFVRGFADGMVANSLLNKSKSCVDEGLLADELVAIVLKSYNNHPERHSWSASELTTIAFAETFCPIGKES